MQLSGVRLSRPAAACRRGGFAAVGSGGREISVHGRRSAAATPQHGAQQRAVPRCQLT